MAFNPWQPVKDRPKSYYIIDNVLSSVVHGIGFGLSIAGLVILVVRAAHSHSALRVTTFAIYGACMILLYLFSTLYHSLVFTKANQGLPDLRPLFNLYRDCRLLYPLYPGHDRRG